MIDADRKKIAITVFSPLLLGMLAISLAKILLASPWDNLLFGVGCISATWGIIALVRKICELNGIDQSEQILSKNILLFLLLDAFIAIQIPVSFVQEFLSSLILISIVFITSIPLFKSGVFKSKVDELPVLIPAPKKSISKQFTKFFLFCVLGLIILVFLVFLGSLAVYTVHKNQNAVITSTAMEFALA